MSRNWIFGIGAGVLFGILAAPTLANAQSIGVWVGPQLKDAFEEIATEYTRETGVEITISVGQREDGETVQALLREQLVGGDLPDVVVVNGNLTRVLADRNLAVPLGGLIAQDPLWQAMKFSETVTAAGIVNGEVYGMAVGLSLPVVLFNSIVAEKAGIDANGLPSDWSGIIAAARLIEESDQGVVGGFFEYDNSGAFSFLALLESHGGALMNADETTVGIDTEQGRKALSVLEGFAAAGQARAAMTRDQARQAFGAGTIGVFVTMSSLIPRFHEAVAGEFEIWSTPFPIASADGRLPTAGPIATMLTTGDEDRQAAAFRFMQFVSGAQGQTIIARQTGYVPVNETAIAEHQELQEVLARRPNADAYLSRIEVATRWYAPPGDRGLEFGRLATDYLRRIVVLDATAADVAAELQEAAEEFLIQ